MNKKTNKLQNNKLVLNNEEIGFEWNVTSNYFNKSNCESSESDNVRHNYLILKPIHYHSIYMIYMIDILIQWILFKNSMR